MSKTKWYKTGLDGPGLTAPPAPWIAPDAPAAEHSESSAIPEPKQVR